MKNLLYKFAPLLLAATLYGFASEAIAEEVKIQNEVTAVEYGNKLDRFLSDAKATKEIVETGVNKSIRYFIPANFDIDTKLQGTKADVFFVHRF